jgi:Protein of unknown function (DUF3309)
MLGTILIIVVFLMLVGVLPRWSHSRQWGYFPSVQTGAPLATARPRAISVFEAAAVRDSEALRGFRRGRMA